MCTGTHLVEIYVGIPIAMDGKIYSLVLSRSGCQLPRPLLTTVCTSVSEAVYLLTCGNRAFSALWFTYRYIGVGRAAHSQSAG